jgi:hypothetical protein
MKRFDYIDPRGRRSGPYTEEELKSLAARGLLEPSGTVELIEVGEVGRVATIPWLAPGGEPGSIGAPPPPPPVPAPPRSSEEAIALAAQIDAAATRYEVSSDISRTLYVLLALALPLVGLFGVHNLVAGYTGRGVLAVLVSMFTFGGIACMVAPPCACVSVPLWIVLFAISVIEALAVKRDARGRLFR